MILSDRLKSIADMIESCECLADIGTDHGYIPIYAVTIGKCKRAIASDIKRGPVEIARRNIIEYGVENNVEARIGNGLENLTPGEADQIIIAGMSGNLIAEILDKGRYVAQAAKSIIIQPVQHPEVIRKYLYNNFFSIIGEHIVRDENKYYHIIKVKNGTPLPYNYEAEYYTGRMNPEITPEVFNYITFKVEHIDNIIKGLDTVKQEKRINELLKLRESFKEVERCLLKSEK